MKMRVVAALAVAAAVAVADDDRPPRPLPFKYPNDPRLKTPSIAYLRSMTYYETHPRDHVKTGLRNPGPRQLSLEDIEYLGGPVLRCRSVRTVGRDWAEPSLHARPTPPRPPHIDRRSTTSRTATSSLTSARC